MDMCSKEEVKQAVHEVMFEQKEDGQTYMAREINRHIDRRASQIISSLTIRFSIPFIAAVLAGAGLWYNLQGRVDRIEQFSTEGGRFTQEEANVYAAEVNRRFLELDKDIGEIKDDLSVIRKAVVGY